MMMMMCVYETNLIHGSKWHRNVAWHRRHAHPTLVARCLPTEILHNISIVIDYVLSPSTLDYRVAIDVVRAAATMQCPTRHQIDQTASPAPPTRPHSFSRLPAGPTTPIKTQ